MTFSKTFKGLLVLALFSFYLPQSQSGPWWDSVCAVFDPTFNFEKQSLELEKMKSNFRDLNDKSIELTGQSFLSPAAFDLREKLRTLSRDITKLHNKIAKKRRLAKVIPMDENYIGEFAGVEWTDEFRENGVTTKHFTPSEIARTRVSISENGRLRDSNGKLLSGEYLVVLLQDPRTAEFELRAYPYAKVDQGNLVYVRHSTLSNGVPVVAPAGLRISHGIVNGVSYRSGHYMPSKAIVNQLVEYLVGKGYSRQALQLYYTRH